jgi:hypothetical protein
MTNKTLKEWYLAGYNDELKGASTIMDGNPLNERTYSLGAKDALQGNKIKSVADIIRVVSKK